MHKVGAKIDEQFNITLYRTLYEEFLCQHNQLKTQTKEQIFNTIDVVALNVDDEISELLS